MPAVNASDHRDGDRATLGSLLRAKRKAAGLSISQMASQLGMSRTYLSRLEQGRYTNPSSKLLMRIAMRFDLTVEDVYPLSGYFLPADLPSFGLYLRAKHPDWPELVIKELSDFKDFLKQKYSLQ